MRETMKITVSGEDADGGFDEEIEVPARWEICQTCRGNGTHVNRNIDGNGITSEQWDEWDDEEREGYFAGRYDVKCEDGCHDGKVQVVDYESCTSEQKKQVDECDEQQRANARYDAEDRATRRAENGYRE